MKPAVLLGLTLMLASAPADAQTVIDGDTLKLDGTTFRLWGIDAPEAKQRCGDYPAGSLATGALEKLITGKRVECEKRATDRYGRTVALCRADGEDVSRAMVRLGMAWAFTRYSLDYVAEEQAAKGDGLGIHAHACEPAWQWRASKRP